MTNTAAQANTAKPSHKPSAAKVSPPAPKDAIAMLRAEHEEVVQLFAEYGKARSATSKKALIADICAALTVHAQIEEELFYPAIQSALKDKLLVPEATVEHGCVKALIAQLEGAEPGGEMVDAQVKVLSEYVKHHVKEEHTEMFPKAKASSIDMVALGALMAVRKGELMALAA